MLYALLLFQHYGSVYITVYIFQKTVFDIYVAACTLPIYWLPVKREASDRTNSRNRSVTTS